MAVRKVDVDSRTFPPPVERDSTPYRQNPSPDVAESRTGYRTETPALFLILRLNSLDNPQEFTLLIHRNPGW